jgi:6-phosphogluconate dehydrogenase
MAKTHSDIGLIGLAVMGQNLALNIADHGFQISVFNRTVEKTEKFVAENPNTPGGVVGTKTLEEFVQSLARPRKAIILVQAGKATDAVIDSLVPLFEAGDIIIDGGNALWTDTIRREKALREKGLLFIGSGVSGGEEGARFGPALMPGGDKKAYKEHLEKIWNAVAAKVDAKTGKPLEGAAPGKPIQGGVPCATYIGENGAGHYVKMVHNGIEYGDMQMICEAYDLMKRLGGFKAAEMGAIFTDWNQGMLGSFLIEITADILKQKDPVSKKPIVDVILDTAGQKGTGKWTSVNALDMGVPAPTIAESVFARCVSAIKEERVAASKILKGPSKKYKGSKKALIEAIHDALYCSKICSYAQGFQLMREAQKEYKWTLNFGEIAQIWRGGCIIRAVFLQKITEAYQRDPNLANLLLDPYFNKTVKKAQENWRKVVALAAECGVPVPTFSSALSYYDGYRSARLPANLLQGQRDFFGAHTYERTDQPRGKFFHIDWPEPTRPQLAI